jgi:PAS domain S-box-containing protein
MPDSRYAADVEQFRRLFERIVDYAVVLLTTDGHIAAWNPGAQRLEGYGETEIVGQSVECLYTVEDRIAGRPHQLLETARQVGRVEDEGWRVRKMVRGSGWTS